jgi:hypothetical protein
MQEMTDVTICGIPCTVPQSWVDMVEACAAMPHHTVNPDGSYRTLRRYDYGVQCRVGCECTDCSLIRRYYQSVDAYRKDNGLPV